MAHEIEIINGVASMAFNSQNGMPWHGLGTPVDHAMTADEALRAANLDWKVVQKPLYVNSGKLQRVPNWVANVRSFDDAVLGVVTARYTPLQNDEAFAFLDELVGFGAAFETAMSLANGRRVVITVKLPKEITVAGDKVVSYITITNGHDGKTGVLVYCTPIRVVCANTENMAIQGAPRLWKVKHMGDVTKKVENARDAIDMNDVYLEALQGHAEKQLAIAFPATEWQKLVNTLIPEPESDKPLLVTRWMDKQNELDKCIQKPDLANIKFTGWGAIQAVSDYVTHGKADGRSAADVKFERLISGHALLDMANEFVMSLS